MRYIISLTLLFLISSCEKFDFQWNLPRNNQGDTLRNANINGSDWPLAKCSSSRTLVPLGSTVQFTSNSLNKPTDFEWFFEGGSPLISNASSVSVTYNSIGSYDVKLKVKNGVGFDSTIRTDYIKSYYFKSFANGLFDGWSQNGWNFSTSPTCQGCIYVWQNSGSGNQVYTLSKNFGAINGKLDLNFYYNIYSPGGTLRVLVNGSEVWSSSGYSAEDIQLQLPEVGNYSVTFEATIGYTQTIYLNNIKIMPR